MWQPEATLARRRRPAPARTAAGPTAICVALLFVCLYAPQVRAGTLFGSTNGGQLFTIDENTGLGSPTCLLPSMSSTEIEYDSGSQTAFSQWRDGMFTGEVFDIHTCLTMPSLGNAHSFTGLEYIGGVLYGTAIDASGGPSALRILDPNTGTSVLIGATGVGPISGLAYNGGALYGIAGGPGPANFYTIDLGTGVATLVGNTGIQAGSLEFGSGGRLFAGGTGANAGELWEISPTTGAGALVGSTGLASGITGLAYVDTCGDGSVDPGEQCDDGNTADGDCCSSTCQYEADGSPCADADPCTRDTCDGAGSCGQLPTGCLMSGKSLLLLKNDADDDAKDKLVWKWLKGEATSLEDLGVPTGTTNYTLCLYAGSASAAIALPAGSNWQPAGSKGYKFKDPTGTPDGALKAVLKSGDADKAKALVKGKGTNLPDTLAPELPLPVTAQLVNDANTTCFEATYSTAIKNDEKQFKAKAP